VQDGVTKRRFIGLPVFADFESVSEPFDAVLITDLTSARATCDAAIACCGAERVLVPELLRLRMRRRSEAAT
jgi:hypothetical protein